MATRDDTKQDAVVQDQVMPRPTRQRVNPLAVLGSLGLILGGAALGGWAFTTMNDTQSVVAVRADVQRGETIEREDLYEVQVNADPALSPVPGDQLESFVGKRAAYDLREGSLLTDDVASGTIRPKEGEAVVGLALDVGRVPSVALREGDRVLLVETPDGKGGGDKKDKDLAEVPAEVLSHSAPDPQRGKTETQVSVIVKKDDAAKVATAAAAGQVALVLDSRER